MKEINVFNYDGSGFPAKIKKIMKNEKDCNMNYYSYSDLNKKFSKKADVILFEEEDSFISSSGSFNKLISSYDQMPPVIVIISNKEIINIVRWMRKGTSDCLWIGDINKDILNNSIKDSIEFTESKKRKIKKDKKITAQNILSRKVINIPETTNWNSLKDNNYYDYCLVMIEAEIDKTAIGRYSTEAIEKIYQKVKSESESLSTHFGGKNWFWTNNSGVQIFYFGDRVDCAVLSAITFFVRFFIFCIEKIGLEEVLNLRIGVHDGNGIYQHTKTSQITSDIINSLNHLTFQYTKNNTLTITKDVYDKLSNNLKLYFKKSGLFEGRDIYSYHFYDAK